MAIYKTKWTGEYPNLCYGEWKLYVNGKISDIEIPFQYHPANTLNSYSKWGFDDQWSEYWESYIDGMDCIDWCKKYSDYLTQIAPESDWPTIFEAFQENDWRHGQCGGCI